MRHVAETVKKENGQEKKHVKVTGKKGDATNR